QSPLAKMRRQKPFIQLGQISNSPDTQLMQSRFSLLTNSRYLADFKRRQKTRLHSRQNVQNPIRLGLVGRNLRHQPRSRQPKRTVQSRFAANGFMQSMRRGQGRSMQ